MKNYLLLFGLFVTLFFSSCGLFKNSTGDNQLQEVVGEGENKPLDPSQTDPNATLPVNTVDTIVWCDTLQETEYKRLVLCYKKIGTNPIVVDTTDVLLDMANPFAILEQAAVVKQKPIYNIAVLLPFGANKINLHSMKELPKRSMRAINFYEGLKLAADSLKQYDVNIKINVYDTEMNNAKVEKILAMPELAEADIIFGPARTSALKLIAEYTRTNNQILLSPFNTRGDFLGPTEGLLQLNPSVDIHSKYTIELLPDLVLEGVDLPENYIIFAMERDSVAINSLEKYFYQNPDNEGKQLTKFILKDRIIEEDALLPLIKKDFLNVVMIPSFRDDGFVMSALRELGQFKDPEDPEQNHEIIVIGSRKWLNIERLDYEAFEKLNLHLTNEYFIDHENPSIKAFSDKYRYKYNVPPSDFSYMGFDMMLYVGKQLSKYGTSFPYFIYNKPSRVLHTTLHFEPIFSDQLLINDNTPHLLRFENTYLNILRFEDYKFTKIELIEND